MSKKFYKTLSGKTYTITGSDVTLSISRTISGSISTGVSVSGSISVENSLSVEGSNASLSVSGAVESTMASTDKATEGKWIAVNEPLMHYPAPHVRLEPTEVASPPRMIENIIWFALPRKVRDAVMGDAEEAYHETLQRYGRRAANWDYCKQAAFAILFALWSPIQTLLGCFRKSS